MTGASASSRQSSRAAGLAIFLAPALALGACGSAQVDTQPPPASVAATLAQPAGPEPAPQSTASVYQLPPGAPPLPPDLLAIGSQDARDDLYCSALIYNANPEVSDALAPVDEALLRKAQMMAFVVGEAGINKLIDQKAAHATHARAIAEAYAAQVEKDVRANATRMTVDACTERAQAIPVPE
ncbi:MAG: hypothetical protein R3C46_08860 [Hyphomonadaceae bacterium]